MWWQMKREEKKNIMADDVIPVLAIYMLQNWSESHMRCILCNKILSQTSLPDGLRRAQMTGCVGQPEHDSVRICQIAIETSTDLCSLD